VQGGQAGCSATTVGGPKACSCDGIADRACPAPPSMTGALAAANASGLPARFGNGRPVGEALSKQVGSNFRSD